MRTLLLFFLFTACASYTDPDQEKLTYYTCEKNQQVVLMHSDDYEDVRMKIGKDQLLLHNFVSARGSGYSNDSYLWLVQGNKGKLFTKENGQEKEILGKCIREETSLSY